MISSNYRARKWFEDQTRQRTIEQMIATLDQVCASLSPLIYSNEFFSLQRNAFLNKQNDLCVKTILRQVILYLFFKHSNDSFHRLMLFNSNCPLINSPSIRIE